jgi:hypothetical protein
MASEEPFDGKEWLQNEGVLPPDYYLSRFIDNGSMRPYIYHIVNFEWPEDETVAEISFEIPGTGRVVSTVDFFPGRINREKTSHGKAVQFAYDLFAEPNDELCSLIKRSQVPNTIVHATVYFNKMKIEFDIENQK